LGDKLSSDLKSDLEAKIADVRAALTGSDVAKIKSSREALEQAFYKASESIYRQGGGVGAGVGSEFSGNPQPTDPGQGDTIEGEYKEM
jgi:molecular chaperone DnaK